LISGFDNKLYLYNKDIQIEECSYQS